MAKVKKNIRAKAKSAMAKVTAELQAKGSKTKAEERSKSDSKLLLHKTISPKITTTKKEKFRQNHKKLMNKLKVIKKQRKEEIASKNREQTAIVKDLKPLKDSLPSLDELIKLSKERTNLKTGVREYDEVPQPLSIKQKLKMKKNKFINKVNSYNALLNDADFKSNPRDVISYHIKYTHGLIDK